MTDATVTTPDTVAESATDGADRPSVGRLRLWPATLLLLSQLPAWWLLPQLAPDSMLNLFRPFLVPGATTLLLVTWWLLVSRASWRERLAGCGLWLALLLIALQCADASLGFVFPVFAGSATAQAAVLALHIPTSPRRSRILALGAILLVCGGFQTVRLAGMSGAMMPQFIGRWGKSAEEALLARRQADTSTVPVTTAKLVMPTQPATGDWPGFRGPHRDGHVDRLQISTDWQAAPPQELWRTAVGPGWSSFCAVGDWLFTQEQLGEEELVVCRSATNGTQQWVNRVTARFEESVGGAGPRATPTFDNGQLFTTGATGIVQCIDPTNGSTIWKRDLVQDGAANVPMWGFSRSPLPSGNLVCVFAGGSDAGVIAYNRQDGSIVWKQGQGSHCYTSAHLAEFDGVPQLLMFSDWGLQSLDVRNGDILWQRELASSGNRITQPLLLPPNAVVLSAGYGEGARRWQITRQAETNEWQTTEVWASRYLKPFFNDGVFYRDHIYGFDGKFLTCIDASNGQRAWKRARRRGSYGHGQLLLLTAQSLLLIQAEDGGLALVEATPQEHRELARLPALNAKTWNHPIIAQGKLFVRNGEEAICFQLPATSAPATP